jgi:hypothetical protein
VTNLTRIALPCSIFFVAALGACGPSQVTPPKSPTGDNQPPATTTGNGEVLGADKVPVGDKLDQGVSVDSQQGIKPAAKPVGD